MKSKQEIKEWILNNCVNNDGDIDLKGLDFRDFDGDVVISHMKVKKGLLQNNHEVGGDLCQDEHEVGGFLYQCRHRVGHNLHQGEQKVGGNLYQSSNEVGGNISQKNSKFGKALYVDKLNEYDITETPSGELKVTNKPKTVKMTLEELEALVGCKFEIVEDVR